MNILHVAPHLGGGVGKAHAALAPEWAADLHHEFLLLEPPRDRRYADEIAASGATVRVASGLDEVVCTAVDADIVQFEFWNHPRLFECLARSEFPAMRSVVWAHVSGLFGPAIPPALAVQAGRFVATTAASLTLPCLDALPAGRVSAINSGFGFAAPKARTLRANPRIAYLGTVDFVKMHQGFFDAVDALDREAIVDIWGAPAIGVMAAALRMERPQGLRFHGQTARPDEALAGADIFFYPLRHDHYGTAENALIEAMSLGLVPVVLGNPAEAAIVTHGETGLVASAIEECPALLRELLDTPALLGRLSANAVAHIAATRTPARSAAAFERLWRALADEAPRRPDFRSALGATPAEWFLASQQQRDLRSSPSVTDIAAAKGTLSHFEEVFAGDASLAALRLRPSASAWLASAQDRSTP
jgi:glycosyltransferase involved in cell wall biosynthesis